MTHWNLVLWLVGAFVVFVLAFILVRTSGDGRSAITRLRHPARGGIQEEYGGDGEGHRLDAEPAEAHSERTRHAHRHPVTHGGRPPTT